jgi:hypothetical protein
MGARRKTSPGVVSTWGESVVRESVGWVASKVSLGSVGARSGMGPGRLRGA